MSFSINSVGKAADVVHAVTSQPYVPDQIKELVAQIGGGVDSPTRGLRVEGYGHLGSAGGGNVTLKIEEFTLASPAPTPVPVPAPAIPAPAPSPEPIAPVTEANPATP